MKNIISAIFLVLCFSSANADTFENIPVNGDDIVSMLELDLSKYQVNFDTAKKVTVRCETSNGHKQDYVIEKPTKFVKVLLYFPQTPKESAPDKYPYVRCDFSITTDGGGTKSTFSFDGIGLKSREWRFIDGVFTITGHSQKKSNSPFLYRIQILTSK